MEDMCNRCMTGKNLDYQCAECGYLYCDECKKEWKGKCECGAKIIEREWHAPGLWEND
jgi:hypothetical protein